MKNAMVTSNANTQIKTLSRGGLKKGKKKNIRLVSEESRVVVEKDDTIFDLYIDHLKSSGKSKASVRTYKSRLNNIAKMYALIFLYDDNPEIPKLIDNDGTTRDTKIDFTPFLDTTSITPEEYVDIIGGLINKEIERHEIDVRIAELKKKGNESYAIKQLEASKCEITTLKFDSAKNYIAAINSFVGYAYSKAVKLKSKRIVDVNDANIVARTHMHSFDGEEWFRTQLEYNDETEQEELVIPDGAVYMDTHYTTEDGTIITKDEIHDGHAIQLMTEKYYRGIEKKFSKENVQEARMPYNLCSVGDKADNTISEPEFKRFSHYLASDETTNMGHRMDNTIISALMWTAARRTEIAMMDYNGLRIEDGKVVEITIFTKSKGGHNKERTIPVSSSHLSSLIMRHIADYPEFFEMKSDKPANLDAAKNCIRPLFFALTKSGTPKYNGAIMSDQAIYNKVKSTLFRYNRKMAQERDDFKAIGEFGRNYRSDFTAAERKKFMMDNEVSTHDFRRTFATLLVKAGYPIELISKFLGHASVETTMIYIMDVTGMSRDMITSFTRRIEGHVDLVA